MNVRIRVAIGGAVLTLFGAHVVSLSVGCDRLGSSEGNYPADLRAMPPAGRKAGGARQSKRARSDLGRE